MKRDLQYLAQLESYTGGKVLKDAIFDVYASIYALEYYAGWCDKIHGQVIPAGTGQKHFYSRVSAHVHR